VVFNQGSDVALGDGSICPFNSQNTTWFKEAFELLYLPSYCSFRMTDIWRSLIAQRIAWTCNWSILFHKSTMRQSRNTHNLLKDFSDEQSGYLNNARIMTELNALKLKKGQLNIASNMEKCYRMLISMGLIDKKELKLLNAWLADVRTFR
jgi:hypothetical protein